MSKAPTVSEVIIATNPNTEGDVTAAYLARVLAPLGARRRPGWRGVCRQVATWNTPTS